ncbi:hypothetical protein B9Z55_017155 [Caenorhabditis nigoni]|uniref:Uncharacterized protein n=1 Tax=Caenorhabditis nigoni TaxID=1611254 RepID=A0A2G5T892_9PELO|nr:hypothetical protein B9Z55_017155 [Caenorhabditis nigoni]
MGQRPRDIHPYIRNFVNVISNDLPNYIAKQISTTQFFSYENIGPYGAVAKMLGCAIEAFLVFRTMRKGKGSRISEDSIRLSGK